MKRCAYLTLAMVLALGVGVAMAQEKGAKAKSKTLSANGVVTAVSNATLSIESGKKTMTFTVDSSTHVLAKGASTATKEKKEAGAGLAITDAVHQGDQVTVRYHDVGGTMHASDVQVRVPRPASATKKKS